MTAIELKSTEVHTITILLLDPTTQAPEPIPAGDVFTVEASSPAIETVIGVDANGNPAVVLRALTLPSVNTMGMNFTVSDSLGDVVCVQGVDYPMPPQPEDIALDLAGAVVTVQDAPTAPGP